MKATPLSLVAALVSLPSALPADDLATLVKEYLAAKPEVKGAPDDRASRAKELVAPILKQIGDLDTNESLAFLVQELDAPVPEIGAQCAAPILQSKRSNAPALLLKGFSKRPLAVQSGIVDALAASSRDLAPVEAELVQIAHSSPETPVRRRLPLVLAKLESLVAAKAMLACVKTETEREKDKAKGKGKGWGGGRGGWGKGRGRGQGPEEPRDPAEVVFDHLKQTKNDAVKKWLAGGAFEAARGDAARNVLVARLAGELKLAGAREELYDLSNHKEKQVAAAAVAALGQIGFGESPREIVAAIEKRKGKADAAFRAQALDALAATGTDEALEAVIRFAKGNDPELRAVAMGSLALFKGREKAVAAIIGGLEDPEPFVRVNALKAAAGLRDKSVILPLIKVIEKDPEERLKVQALELLVKISGQNMGLVAADWRKWWDIAEARFEFPSDGKKGSTAVKTYDLSYFGIEISSKKLAFLADFSLSMDREVPVRKARKDGEEKKTGVGGGNGGGEQRMAKKIDLLKREITRVLKALPADTQVNVVPFSQRFTPWQAELQPLAGQGRAKAIEFVRSQTMGFGTNIFDTVEFALNDKRIDTIYLLSDGEPTTGRFREIDGICREVKALNRVRQVTIHTIAFGEESPLLKRIAEENGGEFRFVDSMEE